MSRLGSIANFSTIPEESASQVGETPSASSASGPAAKGIFPPVQPPEANSNKFRDYYVQIGYNTSGNESGYQNSYSRYKNKYGYQPFDWFPPRRGLLNQNLDSQQISAWVEGQKDLVENLSETVGIQKLTPRAAFNALKTVFSLLFAIFKKYQIIMKIFIINIHTIIV